MQYWQRYSGENNKKEGLRLFSLYDFLENADVWITNSKWISSRLHKDDILFLYSIYFVKQFFSFDPVLRVLLLTIFDIWLSSSVVLPYVRVKQRLNRLLFILWFSFNALWNMTYFIQECLKHGSVQCIKTHLCLFFNKKSQNVQTVVKNDLGLENRESFLDELPSGITLTCTNTLQP